MKVENIWWYYIARDLMHRFWNNTYRLCPVLLSDNLSYDILGNFEYIPDNKGFEVILLNKNANLSPRQLAGVLLHEICHLVAFEKYGHSIEPHGLLWAKEMNNCGFSGKINEETSGIKRFSQKEFKDIISLHNHLRSNPSIDIDDYLPYQ